jgi:hypothetical protein
MQDCWVKTRCIIPFYTFFFGTAVFETVALELAKANFQIAAK